jgi:ABC-type phosphate transport system substrate-binding protein
MALAAWIVAPALGAAADFVLVVNVANPTATLTRSEAGRFFLRSATKWPSGENVKPVDLGKGSPVRVSFTREVLGRTMAAVEQYWTQSVFSGRAIPPPEKRSDAEVLAYVRENPGAIGYVAVGVPIDGVKRVTVTQPP